MEENKGGCLSAVIDAIALFIVSAIIAFVINYIVIQSARIESEIKESGRICEENGGKWVVSSTHGDHVCVQEIEK